MSSTTIPVRLTAPKRLARGLKYSAVGPVDVTRGALGVTVNSVRSSAGWIGNRYRRGRIASQVRKDLALAQDAVATVPQVLQEKSKRRPLVLIGAGAAVLAVGAVTFSIVRRSTTPEPSSLQPSVDTTPKP